MNVREILYLLAIAALGVALAWSRYSGHKACVNADTAAAVKQEVKIGTAEGAAGERVKAEGTKYEEAIAAPVIGAPVLLMCPDAPRPRAVLPAPRALAQPGEEAQPGAEDLRPAPAARWDTSPVVQVGRDGDAQINGLLDYIRDNCAAPK